MASIKQLFTREDNNETHKLMIGKEYIEYLGADSDQFIKAKREVQRDVIAGKIKADQIEDYLISALIVGWSFDEECTHEAKVELLHNSPSLRESIDRHASERANFIKRALNGSPNTQKPTSTSQSQQRKSRK